MSVVASHSHSIPRCDQAFFFSEPVWENRVGGAVSMASLGTLGRAPCYRSGAARRAVGAMDFCGFTFLVLFSVARAKPHWLVGVRTGKTA